MNNIKAFVNEKNQTILTCPECNRSKIIDATRYKTIEKPVIIKVRCLCGTTYRVTVERRKYYRKSTRLQGLVYGKSGIKEEIVIKDLSRFGIKFELKKKWSLFVGDILTIEFTLDDGHETHIKKDIQIKSIHGMEIGAAFCHMDTTDLADRRLGFYLMP